MTPGGIVDWWREHEYGFRTANDYYAWALNAGNEWIVVPVVAGVLLGAIVLLLCLTSRRRA